MRFTRLKTPGRHPMKQGAGRGIVIRRVMSSPPNERLHTCAWLARFLSPIRALNNWKGSDDLPGCCLLTSVAANAHLLFGLAPYHSNSNSYSNSQSHYHSLATAPTPCCRPLLRRLSKCLSINLRMCECLVRRALGGWRMPSLANRDCWAPCSSRTVVQVQGNVLMEPAYNIEKPDPLARHLWITKA